MPTPELNKALAAFQAKLPPIAKRETGKVEGVSKQGKPFSYEYSYADLADVSEVVLPLLGGHGLAYIAEPGTDESGRLVLDYALLHISGEERAKQFPLWLFVPDRATAQTIGGLITYFRRYCLCAVTGVAPKGEDDDAAEASRQKPGRQQKPAQRGALPRNADGSVSRSRTTDEQKDAAGLMTDAQHAEHTQLQKDAARGRVPGTQRGPLPDDDNPWQEQPPARAGNGRVGLIVQHFERLGVTDRGVRLGYVAALTGHAVNSTNDLSGDEQKQLLDLLSKCRNQAALDQQSKQEVST